MRLSNQHHTITATVETKPILESFDFVYNPANTSLYDFYMARVFHVDTIGREPVSIAIVDHLCPENVPCCVLQDHLLTFVLTHLIVQMDLAARSITKIVKCENMGGLEEIHSIADGYLIKGECDIFRYDLSLKRIWQFSGRDILISPTSNQHFWIQDMLVHCRDFSGWHYILDLEGNLIKAYREFPCF